MKNAKWVLILGSGSDIGKACARKFASEGYNIFLASRNLERCINLAKDLNIRFEIESRYAEYDAKNFASHAEFFKKLDFLPDITVITFGVMFDQNNAQNNFALSKEMIDVNFSGVVSSIENLLQIIWTKNKGQIIVLGSVAGDRGKKSNYIYGASKSAVEVFMQGLDHRVHNNGIKTLLVKPGFVDTKMTANMNLPKFLTCTPKEVANAIYSALNSDKKVIYVKKIWWIIMLIINSIPRSIFNKTSL